MAATAALDKELAAAREPIPVRRADDSVSKGLTNAVDRSAIVSTLLILLLPLRHTSLATTCLGCVRRMQGWSRWQHV